MYAKTPLRLGRYGANRKLRGASFGRVRRLGDSIDWGDIITTGINDAAGVAKVALQPVPSVRTTYPGGGSQVIDYGITPAGSMGAQSMLTGQSLFNSPILIIGFLLIGGLLLVRR